MIVTFYSYKGGVGRSMAMANVADLLARRGLRVLMIDFDLEAPGLERFFQINQDSVHRHPGLLDLLLSYKQSMSVAGGDSGDFREVARFICPVYESLPDNGRLDLMPAGQRHGTEQLARYALNLRTFDWQDFYFNWQGELFFEWLRRTLTKDLYDVVLVDSRTGVTEMGGICGYQLPDAIVMMCAANHQNVEGTRDMVRDFRSPNVEALRHGRPLHVVVVPARIEQRDDKLLEAFFERFDAAFANMVPAPLVASGVSFRGLMVPYEPEFAFEERVLSAPKRAAERRRIGGAFERLTDAVAALAPPGSKLSGQTVARAAVEGSERLGDRAASPTAAAVPAPAAQYNATHRFSGFDVFLDFGTPDSEPGELIYQDLLRRGFQVFCDRKDVPAGAESFSLVESVLFHARALVYCVGAQGLSTWRRRTLEVANKAKGRGQDLAIIPILLPGAPALDSLGAAGVEGLDARNGIDRSVLDRLDDLLHRSADAMELPVQTEQRTPYVGPRSFAEQDADLLFGRDELLAQLLDKVNASRLPNGSPLVFLEGDAGTGKTSLVQAGLIPRLRATEQWTIVTLSPDELMAWKAPEGRRADQASGSASTTRLLVFIDHAESVQPAVRDAFVRRLGHLPDELAGGDCALVALRTDFIRYLTSDQQLHYLDRARVTLGPMRSVDLRRVIVSPAEKVGLAFEPGLVERILRDIEEVPQAIFLLQRVLTGLWQRRRDGWLTNAAYDAMGGLVGNLDSEVEEFFVAQTPERQAVTRAILTRLVSPELTRLALPVDAIRPPDAVTTADQRVGFDSALEALLAGHILTATVREGLVMVEITHEAIIHRWQRMAEWLEQDRQVLEWRQLLDSYVERWKAGGREENLLRGALLRGAAQQRREHPDQLSQRQIELIDVSLKARKVRRAAAALTIGVIAVMVVFVGIAALAQRNDRQREAVVRQAAGLRAEADGLATTGKVDDALAKFAEAEALEPDNASVHFRRGRLLFEKKVWPEAEAQLTKAIALESSQASSSRDRLLRAQVRMLAGNLTGAREDLEAASAGALDWLALGGAEEAAQRAGETEDDRLHRAISAYDQAILRDPTLAEAYFNRGQAKQRLGDRPGAVADFERITAFPEVKYVALKDAAEARLKVLAPGRVTEAVRDVKPSEIRLALQYADKGDRDTVRKLWGTLKEAGYKVDEPEVASDGRGGQVRYFFPGDSKAAAAVVAIVQGQLAKLGSPTRLVPRYRDAKPFPNVRHRTLEVWLPPLSLPVTSSPPPAAGESAY